MKVSVKNIVVIFLLNTLFESGQLFGQDPIFSQFYAHPLYTNPAFAGASEYSRFTAGYRNEWPGLGAFNIYDVSFDQPIDFINGGLGVLISNDLMGAGTFSNLQISGIYSYEVNLTKRLNMWYSIQGTYGQRTFNSNSLIFSSGVNPNSATGLNESIAGESRRYFDASLGWLASYENSYAGLTVHHITAPKYSESANTNERLNRKYTFHIGQNIPTNTALFGRKRLFISPNLLVQAQGLSHQQINYGVYLDQHPITMGLWLRQNINFGISGFIISLGLSQDNYRIGYSYDFFINRWESISKSCAHEVTFLLQFEYKSKRKQRGAIKCPKI